MTLRPALSAYLDLMRFVAALAVLLGHMEQDGLSMAWMPLSRFSHEAVIIFFVLSGFIIYYSTTSRTTCWQQYAIARLSRIYSVALPAVLTCMLLALWLAQQADFDVSRLSNYARPTVWDAVSSLLFLNQSWMNKAAVPLNNPYWSLCYEVLFYVLFGAYFFTRGRQRWLLVSIVALVAGPAVLMLLPIWLMGAWLAASGRYATRFKIAPAWLAFVAPLAVIILINVTGVDLLIRSTLYEKVPGYWHLLNSQRFLTDFLIGAALCLHIVAFSSLPTTVQNLFVQYQKWFATLASFSFTLYMFHRPMTQFLGVHYPLVPGTIWQTAIIAIGILFACWVISWGTEKQLPIWRRGFTQYFQH